MDEVENKQLLDFPKGSPQTPTKPELRAKNKYGFSINGDILKLLLPLFAVRCAIVALIMVNLMVM